MIFALKYISYNVCSMSILELVVYMRVLHICSMNVCIYIRVCVYIAMIKLEGSLHIIAILSHLAGIKESTFK